MEEIDHCDPELLPSDSRTKRAHPEYKFKYMRAFFESDCAACLVSPHKIKIGDIIGQNKSGSWVCYAAALRDHQPNKK